jgi:hypothetical protein
MDVIVDTNQYDTFFHGHPRDFFTAHGLVELYAYLRRTKSNLVIPAPVLEETVKKYRDKLSLAVKKA